MYLKNQDQLPNQRFISIVDFDRRANTPRLFTINLSTGRVDKFFVSSSYGSSRAPTGTPPISATASTRATRTVWAARRQREYRGVRGRRSLVLHGFEKNQRQHLPTLDHHAQSQLRRRRRTVAQRRLFGHPHAGRIDPVQSPRQRRIDLLVPRGQDSRRPPVTTARNIRVVVRPPPPTGAARLVFE